jgi:ribosomal protein L6P/L9E
MAYDLSPSIAVLALIDSMREHLDQLEAAVEKGGAPLGLSNELQLSLVAGVDGVLTVESWSTYSVATEDDDGTKRTRCPDAITLAAAMLQTLATGVTEKFTYELVELGYYND